MAAINESSSKAPDQMPDSIVCATETRDAVRMMTMHLLWVQLAQQMLEFESDWAWMQRLGAMIGMKQSMVMEVMKFDSI